MRQEFRKVFIVSTKKLFSLMRERKMRDVSRTIYRKVYSYQREKTRLEVRIASENFDRLHNNNAPEKSVLIIAKYVPQEWEKLPFDNLYQVDWYFYEEQGKKEKIIVNICEDFGACDTWKAKITDLLSPVGEKKETLKKVKEMLKKIEEEINED